MIMDWRLVFIHLLYSSILITPSLTILITWWTRLVWHLVWHCTACTVDSHVEAWTWCIPLSVQYTLLSGWELGCPFRALLTQPFMFHSDSQTTTMTLPSSSSSSYSHCTHIVPSLLGAKLRILCTRVMCICMCVCMHDAYKLELSGFWRWSCLLWFVLSFM